MGKYGKFVRTDVDLSREKNANNLIDRLMLVLGTIKHCKETVKALSAGSDSVQDVLFGLLQ